MCAHNAHSSIDTLTADNITASALSTTHSHLHKKHNIPLPAIICLVYQSVQHELLPERLLQRSNVACSATSSVESLTQARLLTPENSDNNHRCSLTQPSDTDKTTWPNSAPSSRFRYRAPTRYTIQLFYYQHSMDPSATRWTADCNTKPAVHHLPAPHLPASI